MSRRKKTGGKDDDEVEEMLRAAEDELLLNLSVNSHTSRGGSNTYIDPDLDRRFQALKSSKPSSNSPPPPTTTVSPPQTITTVDHNHGDDLFGRFAALKTTSLPQPSTTTTSISSSSANRSFPISENRGDLQGGDDDVVDEDEVQKLIQWAMDAARLDPSPPSDDDDDNDDDNDSDSGDDNYGDQKKHGKKGRPK